MKFKTSKPAPVKNAENELLRKLLRVEEIAFTGVFMLVILEGIFLAVLVAQKKDLENTVRLKDAQVVHALNLNPELKPLCKFEMLIDKTAGDQISTANMIMLKISKEDKSVLQN